jgi:hypothetical protein
MLWTLWFFKPDPLAGEPQAPAPERLGSGLLEGLQLVRHYPEIRFCVLIALAGAMLFDLSVSAPPFASRALHLGGGGYGALIAAFGLGALPGALATALSPVVAAAFAELALSGFLSIWLIATASTLVQLRSEPRLRGRIMGIWTMALPGSYPVSGLLIALVSAVSPRAGFSLAGLAMVALALATRQ